MAATIAVIESNGLSASRVDTAIIAMPMGSVDAHDLVPATYPIAAGQNSYEKWLRLKFEDISTLNQLDNLKAFITLLGDLLLGESIKINGTTSETIYAAAVYPTLGPSAAISLVTKYIAPTSEPPQSNIGIGGALSGRIIPATVLPFFSDYLVLQLQTLAVTPGGDVNPKVLVLQWDEQ